MRAVLFEGTPEEFARVDAMFRAGGDPALQIRSIALPLSRPKAWPELGEEHCYQLAKRVLERAPASLVEALGTLAETQNLHGEQTIEAWASDANQLPDELCGMLAELGRCASRAFIELFGCERAPERVKGATGMLLEKIPSDHGAYFAVRPGLMRAMAELDLLDPLVGGWEENQEAPAPELRPTVAAPRPSPPPAKAPPGAARPVPVRQPVVAKPEAARPSGSPVGILGDVARILAPFAGSATARVPAPPAAAGAEKPSPAPAVKPERNPFSLLHRADPDS
jgi:hypothetical protein